jgi:sn-glycerol 3-phosphate transport system permease protein
MKTGSLLTHAAILICTAAVIFQIYYTLIASTHSTSEILSPPLSLSPGRDIVANYWDVLAEGTGRAGFVPLARIMLNTAVVAILIATGKIVISILSAYAIIFFRFPLRILCFWMIFLTLMLPVEVRIVPTYQVIVDLGLVDTFGGLTLPLIASATATFLFRQFFLTIPDALVEAARMDGAGPLRFFWSILLPLSRTK